MITDEQAIEIKEYLTSELSKNGFGDVVSEVNLRLEEDYRNKDFFMSSQQLVLFFLNESIDILESLSNRNYETLIDRLNNFLSEGEVKNIEVESLDEGGESFNLKGLPDYNEITTTFKEILVELQK